METWKTVENGDSVKPAALDTESSRKRNYVRKDFVFIEAEEEDEYEKPAHWEYLERKVAKEDWETYMSVIDHAEALNDVYVALTELAELIEG